MHDPAADYFATSDRDTLLPEFPPLMEHVTMWTDAASGLPCWRATFEPAEAHRS